MKNIFPNYLTFDLEDSIDTKYALIIWGSTISIIDTM